MNNFNRIEKYIFKGYIPIEIIYFLTDSISSPPLCFFFSRSSLTINLTLPLILSIYSHAEFFGNSVRVPDRLPDKNQERVNIQMCIKH